MTPPGVFTTAPGQTTTWFQPFTGNVIPPYTTNPISSSNCQTFASSDLFAAEPTVSVVTSGTIVTAVPVTASNTPAVSSGGSVGSSGPASTGSTASGTGGNGTSSAVGLAAPLAVLTASFIGALFVIPT